MAIATSSFFHLTADQIVRADESLVGTALVALPQVRWQTGPGLVLTPDRLGLRRAADSCSGPRVAVCERWFSRGCISLSLHIEVIGPGAVLGVVGRNFCALPEWWEANLTQSRHAYVVDLASGATTFGGRRSSWHVLPRPSGRPKEAPVVHSGTVLHVEIDQQRRELTIEISTNADEGFASINVDATIMAWERT